MASATLDRVYTYHPPYGDQPSRYGYIREAGKEFARLVVSTCPPSREQSVALTKIQETVFWANAAIAVNEIDPDEKVS